MKIENAIDCMENSKMTFAGIVNKICAHCNKIQNLTKLTSTPVCLICPVFCCVLFHTFLWAALDILFS